MPVSAIESGDNFNNAEGVLTVQKQLFGASQSGAFASYFFSNNTSTITMNDGMYSFESSVVTANDPWLTSGYYIDFTFSIPEEGTLTFTHEDSGSYFGGGLVNSSNSVTYFEFTDEILITVFVDDVQQQLLTSSNKFDELSYPISHHLKIRISSNFVHEEEHVFYETSNLRCMMLLDFVLDAYFTAGSTEEPTDPTDPTDPTSPGGGSVDFTEVVDQIIITNGHLEEINGNLVDIKDSIQEIQVEIQDTKEQLEDPTSPIWSAAGEAIGNALEGLFVPSEEDIADVKQGFDDLAKDKLGGAYTAMETVDDLFTDVSGKLNNPSALEGIEFPGIAFPMNGELIVIAEKQMVTLPTSLTAILHPIAGSIITIVVGLGTFGVLKDMVECFLSGFSYAAYLHRNKGGSDE